MDLLEIISQLVVLFAVMAVGILARRLKLIDENGNLTLIRLSMYIATPASIFYSIVTNETALPLRSAALFLALSLGAMLLLYLASLLIIAVLRPPREDRPVYKCMTMFLNVASMGFPVMQAVFGQRGMACASLYCSVSTLLLFTFGPNMLRKTRRNIRWKDIVTPVGVATVAGFIVYYSGVRLPNVVLSTASLLGQFMGPASMMSMGYVLASLKLRDVLLDGKACALTAIKTFVLPLLIWLVFRPIQTDPLFLGTLVIMSAMPVANTVTMLCSDAGSNEALAAKVTMLTNLLTVAAIPLFVLLLSA